MSGAAGSDLPPLVKASGPHGGALLRASGLISGYNRGRVERAAGGKNSGLPKNFRPVKTGAGASAATIQLHRASKDPSVPPPLVGASEVGRGVLSLIERGFLRTSFTDDCSSGLSPARGTIAQLRDNSPANNRAVAAKLSHTNTNPNLVVGAPAIASNYHNYEQFLATNLADSAHNPMRGLLAPVAAQSAPLHNKVEAFRRRDIITGSGGFGNQFGVKYDMKQIAMIPPKALNDPTRGTTTVSSAPAAVSFSQGRVVGSSPPALHDASAASKRSYPPLLDDPSDFIMPELGSAPGGDPLGAGGNKLRDDSRTYAQLLDLYSLHEFIIRKGAALRNTPEFVSYRRSYAHQWGSIEALLRELEALMRDYSVPLAYIDGKKLALLAKTDVCTPSKEQLMACIANVNEVGQFFVSGAQLYRQSGARGHHAAASKIQATFRMHLARRMYQRLRIAAWAARIIQRQWACHVQHKRTRRAIAAIADALAMRWRATMESFLQNWDTIQRGRRTIVHIPSLSFPTAQCKVTPFFSAMQAAQLPRIADLRDPDVEVVLVTPYKLEPEAIQYYIKTLRAAGASNPEGRLIIVVPENVKRLPSSLSLTRIILFSTNVMRVLASVTKGKNAYIVPGVIGPDELLLASKLNLPMLSCEPRLAPALATKSGQRAVLEAADAAFPLGAYHVRSIKELYAILARLIIEYRDISRWLIKIDTESGSRGHAVLDVQRLRSVAEAPGGVITVESVVSELVEHGSKRMRILHPSYPDWIAYSAAFDLVGGCLEAVPSRVLASPTVNLFLEPNGNITIQSVVENVFSPALSVLGCTFPQTVTPVEALREASLSIARAALARRVLGYMSVDFVLFEQTDRSNGERSVKLWTVDIDFRLTNNACVHNYLMLVTGSKFDPETFKCGYYAPAEPSKGQTSMIWKPLKYIYSGLFYNPYIGAIRHGSFFNLCRQKGFSYDTRTQSGVLFHLVDVLLKGCLGVVCVGPFFSQCLQQLADVQQLIQMELPREADSATESNYSSFVTAVKHLSSLKHFLADKASEGTLTIPA